jgi:hypothetical protein
MRVPESHQFTELAKVCGMGWEFQKHSRNSDYFGPLIRCVVGDPEGFVTRIAGDTLRYFGSEVALSDGDEPVWLDDRFMMHRPTCFTRKVTSKLKLPVEEQHYQKRPFMCPDATFAVTHTMGIVERVFLFISQPQFDIQEVTEVLRLFYWEQQIVRTIFLLKTTKS